MRQDHEFYLLNRPRNRSRISTQCSWLLTPLKSRSIPSVKPLMAKVCCPNSYFYPFQTHQYSRELRCQDQLRRQRCFPPKVNFRDARPCGGGWGRKTLDDFSNYILCSCRTHERWRPASTISVTSAWRVTLDVWVCGQDLFSTLHYVSMILLILFLQQSTEPDLPWQPWTSSNCTAANPQTSLMLAAVHPRPQFVTFTSVIIT